MTIEEAVQDFINIIYQSRSENTEKSYSKALAIFEYFLNDKGINISETPVSQLSEKYVGDFSSYLKSYSPATEQLYITALKRFYKYLISENLCEINLQRVEMIIQSRTRRMGKRLPQFPKSDLAKIIEYAADLPSCNIDNENQQYVNYRDAAFILTLADTGMRVHEICNLRRGDIDWNEFKAQIIGKGNTQAVVRFSNRSIHYLKSYLNLRAKQDGHSGQMLSTLPIFARHDKAAGKKILPISTTTGRKIIKQRAKEVLGEALSLAISPHSFRHLFVTNVLIASGGNLKLAQELARHKNIQVTQRYAHLNDDELDKGYYEIFNS